MVVECAFADASRFRQGSEVHATRRGPGEVHGPGGETFARRRSTSYFAIVTAGTALPGIGDTVIW